MPIVCMKDLPHLLPALMVELLSFLSGSPFQKLVLTGSSLSQPVCQWLALRVTWPHSSP